MNFASDNTSAAHPRVMEALAAANSGHVASYAHDPLTAAAEAQLRALFEAPEAEVYLVAGGTAANALALASISPPWGKIFCSDSAHVLTSECGAIPFQSGGAELVPVAGDGGLIAPDALAQALHDRSRRDVHAGERAALTLTNATEWGRLYTPEAVAALSAQSRDAGMAVHMDGARFANAVAALGCAPADLSHRAGVDALTFGGTKNGAMMLEAVLVFHPARAHGFDMRRMRAGHLMSKHRFLAAQMLALLDGGLWLELASHANRMAARLAGGLAAGGTRLIQPQQTNQVFAELSAEAHARATAAGARYYLWPMVQEEGGPVTVRLVCGWSTTEAEVDALIAALAG